MVITLDKHKKPLGVCTERRARILMGKGRACIHRHFPMSIIIKDADVRTMQSTDTFRIKIDPGSIHTGIAVVRETDNSAVFFMQVEHRAGTIVLNLKTRQQTRRNRRSRETRYRRPKWGNKQLAKGKKPMFDSRRPDGWLPPSVKSIGDNIIHTVEQLKELFNITSCSFEAVRFDTQLMDNPDIEGKEYQHGTLFGYELREYLLDRYGHVCQYCGGASGDKVLEWKHVRPRSRGGSDSVRNATLACRTCNQAKADQTPEEWLKAIQSKKKQTKLDEARVKGIQAVMEHKTAGKSNRYCAWAGMLRKATERELFAIFGDVECSSGGRTKYNWEQLGLPKDHHYDALCVGAVPEEGYHDLTNGHVLYAKAIGRGSRFRGKTNKCGIIIKKLPPREKRVFGFQNGDIVLAKIPKDKYEGRYIGRVMTRARGRFDIRTTVGELVNTNYKYCRLLQKNNGYIYSYTKGNSSR